MIQADVFMICVAADDAVSLESVDDWLNETNQLNDNKPVVLLLTKTDISEANKKVSLSDVDKKKQEHNL